MTAKRIAFAVALSANLLLHLYIQVTTWGDYWANLITVFGVFVVLVSTTIVTLVAYAIAGKLTMVVNQVFLGALLGFVINLFWAGAANDKRKEEEFAYREGPYNGRDSIFFMIRSDSLEEIPMEMIAKEKVSTIVIESKTIRELPYELVEVKNLRQLNLYGCESLDLEQALDIISRLNLEELHISSQTGYFPPTLASLQSIKKLNLSGTHTPDFDSLFNLLSSLNNLEHLYLHHIKAEHLPESVSKLKKLKSLHLSFGDFVDLPHSLIDMDSLNTLVLHKTPVYSNWWDYLDSTKIRFEVLPKKLE